MQPTKLIRPGIIQTLSAAQAADLDERGIPKQLGDQFRAVVKAAYDPESHTVTAAVSSETPVDRWYGVEILSHEKGAIRTDRLKNGIPLLFNHDMDQHLGRSVSWKLRDDGVLQITSRFGTNPLAAEKENDVKDEILVDVSIGYRVYEWEITEDKNGFQTYRAVDWEIYEWSLVTVPADPTVGVGRNAAPVKVRSFTRLEDDPAPEATRAAETPADTVSAPAPTEQTRSKAADPDDDEDDDEDDPDDEDERAASIEPTSTTTQPIEQRTYIMEDPQQQNKERLEGLRALRTQYAAHYSEKQLLDDISGTRSVDQVRTAIADAIIAGAQNTEVRTASEQLFGRMSEKERKSYSLRNVYAHAINQRMPGTFSDKGAEAGFEREISQELRKNAEIRGISDLGGGTLVPSANSRVFAEQLLNQRTIASGGNAGTATNFTTVANEVVELLRFRTALLAMGATYMPGLHGQFQMPTQTAAATSSWLTEGTAVTSSDPTLGSFLMNPKRMSIANSYYRDFMAQSGLAIDGFLANDRQNVTARSLDTAGMAGSGTLPVPLGLINRSGIAAVLSGSTRAANGTVTAGAGGVPMTFVDYNNMEATIDTANGDIGTLGFITTPKVRSGGRSTPKIPGTASEFVWSTSPVGANGVSEGPLGYKALCTANPALTGFTANSVSGLHAVLMGVWSQLLIGDWDLSEIIVDPYTGAASAMVKITEHAYYDIAVRQLAAFCVCLSALPQ